ncbi:disulfide bond formation protein B [Agrobacterium vitis]|uniref:Disulfide bond formation protein B n=1 Tax=Agrobacterium vitis TaxID=373 RepID=A0A368NRG9_AGRVI|nr:disulfide bond formation protein B [Agrobacterium vitis]KAA3516955.1 disulfide bond formation protein B [Agrobacterium vitis]KAA3529720.1 disulfide bond formation protein B [Agrobacterium vitis]MCF1477253.1 disulfide bond formation protein B [Agrobacterium vitis]MUZ97402.1 disulfide bond formation protein B [Agrobacterium vitis]MVA27984.1 disulfide bond formation protein B [Agrobacterium vitis]
MTTLSSTRPGLAPALLLTLGMAGVVGSALAFEYLGGYIPCELCLLQRKPYYIGAAIGVVTVIAAALNLPAKVTKSLILLLGLIMIVSAGLGVYHAGVEWHFWEGPSACSATSGAGFNSSGDILAQLNSFKGPSCTEAALRIFGVSLAGWNVLTSLVLAAIAFWGAQRMKA